VPFRRGSARLPGDRFAIEFLEFQNDKLPQADASLQHAGAANLQMRIADLERLQKALLHPARNSRCLEDR
jgi:hypothetical protein